jgi:hypothetical protein
MGRVLRSLVCIAVFAALAAGAEAGAQNRRFHRTVSECAQDLSREVFSQTEYKKAEKYCRDYSQRTIDCATQLAQAKRLTYSFEKAVADCNRKRDKETEY